MDVIIAEKEIIIQTHVCQTVVLNLSLVVLGGKLQIFVEIK